jgi:predicted membrane protein
MERSNLLFTDNLDFLEGKTTRLVNEQEIKQNIFLHFPSLRMPIVTGVSSLILGLSATVSGIWMFADYLISFLGQISQFIISLLLLERLFFMLVGLGAIYYGFLLLTNFYFSLKFLLRRNAVERIYQHTIEKGEVKVGTVVQIKQGNNKTIHYEYDKNRFNRVKSFYRTTSGKNIKIGDKVAILTTFFYQTLI